MEKLRKQLREYYDTMLLSNNEDSASQWRRSRAIFLFTYRTVYTVPMYCLGISVQTG